MSEASTVEITYPPELPVTQRREDIAAAIRDHQVVIIAGETGSGKTTQIPKICLELGRGRPGPGGGLIGHTQPRRIAARSVAERIASELKTELGDLIGYQVRFTDRVGRDTQIKLMTDGILLAELEREAAAQADVVTRTGLGAQPVRPVRHHDPRDAQPLDGRGVPEPGPGRQRRLLFQGQFGQQCIDIDGHGLSALSPFAAYRPDDQLVTGQADRRAAVGPGTASVGPGRSAGVLCPPASAGRTLRAGWIG